MFAARSVLRAFNLGRNLYSIRMSSISPTLSFDAYDAYGFDIDHTLAKYNLPNLFTVCCLIGCLSYRTIRGFAKQVVWLE